MQIGRTAPCLLAICRSDGSEVEVVAKFSAGCELGVGGLVSEVVAAELAALLDLPAPTPYLVGVDAQFVELVRMSNATVANQIEQSCPVAFGSEKLPAGFGALPTGKPIPLALRAVAAEIFAFDVLIQNPDRRVENPNFHSDGVALAIFDHE